MRQKCEYCGTWLSDTDEVCPSCGAPNPNLVRAATGIPSTIEELKAFANAHNLPLDKMRFFLGEDYRGPRAYGIYRDDATGNFIVYKNKSDGSRAIRYSGKDEAYAVNELYQKMHAEVVNQKAHRTQITRNSGGGAQNRQKKHPLWRRFLWIIVILYFVTIIGGRLLSGTYHSRPSTGYYTYGGSQYYNYSHDWYYYDDVYDDWFAADDVPDELTDNYDSYYQGYSYDTSYDTSDFQDSDWYDPSTSTTWDDDDDNSSWSSSWDDDDWDWDSDDDWDSGWSDWDSDW